MTHFLQTGGKTESPFATQREAKRIALVIFSSNSSLCGGFNSNVIRSYHQWLDEHAQIAKENLIIYPVGRKIADAVKKSGFTPAGDYTHMADKPNYTECEEFGSRTMRTFFVGRHRPGRAYLSSL